MTIITKKTWIFVLIIILSVTGILSYHEVDNSITSQDREYIIKYLKGESLFPLENRTYDKEIKFIHRVQKSVLKIASKNDPIPFDTKREPKDLYLAKTGLCYDRSRVIEKVLRYSGFQTRHISIFSTKDTNSGLKSLLTKRIGSHAILEVLTLRGWLVVDSNVSWISLDSKENPMSISQIQADVGIGNIKWKNNKILNIYTEPFIIVYGLYSRHGRFYPPYNFIPDVNYKELIYNFK